MEPSDPEVGGDIDSLGVELLKVVGERVRGLRRDLGQTLQQFAGAAEISTGMLSRLERGLVSPSLSTLAGVASAAGVPVTSLFRGLDEEHDAVIVPQGGGLEIIHEGSGPGRIYQDLGSLRGPNREIEPVLITLTDAKGVFPVFQHTGVELIHVLEGSLIYGYGSAHHFLGPGYTMHIRGEVAHGPIEILELPVRFLSLKVYPSPDPR